MKVPVKLEIFKREGRKLKIATNSYVHTLLLILYETYSLVKFFRKSSWEQHSLSFFIHQNFSQLSRVRSRYVGYKSTYYPLAHIFFLLISEISYSTFFWHKALLLKSLMTIFISFSFLYKSFSLFAWCPNNLFSLEYIDISSIVSIIIVLVQNSQDTVCPFNMQFQIFFLNFRNFFF